MVNPNDNPPEKIPLLPKHVHHNVETATESANTLALETNQEVMGYFLMLLAAVGFSVHAIFLRASESYYNVPFSVTVLSRGAIHFFFSSLYFIIGSRPSTLFSTTLTARQLSLLVLRGVVGTGALMLFYFAVTFVPIGDAVAVFFLVPIFTLILSRIFLSEPVKSTDIVSVLLSLFGAFLIAQSPHEENSVGLTKRVVGSIMISIAALLASVAYTIIRHLGMGVSFMSSIFAFSSCCVLGSLLLGSLKHVADIFESENVIQVVVAVAVVGLSSFAAQCALTLGLQRCRAGPGVLIANIEVPITFALGFIFLHEVPSMVAIIGSICIVSAALLVGVTKLRQQRR